MLRHKLVVVEEAKLEDDPVGAQAQVEQREECHHLFRKTRWAVGQGAGASGRGKWQGQGAEQGGKWQGAEGQGQGGKWQGQGTLATSMQGVQASGHTYLNVEVVA